MVRSSALIVVLLCGAACSGGSSKQDDAGVIGDGSVTDAPDSPQDAGVDAMMALPPTEAREVVPGGVRMQGPTYRFDVQLGHAVGQHAATGATYSIEGNTAVKP